jgi:hypothetical protein
MVRHLIRYVEGKSHLVVKRGVGLGDLDGGFLKFHLLKEKKHLLAG